MPKHSRCHSVANSHLVTQFMYHLTVRQQPIRNWGNHHPINYNSMMMMGRNPGRNISSTTQQNSHKRSTMRHNSIHCLRNLILLTIFLNIIPHKIITNNWTRINMTTYSNSTIQSHTSPFTKHSNSTSLRSNCNTSTSRHTAVMLIHDTLCFGIPNIWGRWGFGFSRRWLWRLISYGMWHGVAWFISIYV